MDEDGLGVEECFLTGHDGYGCVVRATVREYALRRLSSGMDGSFVEHAGSCRACRPEAVLRALAAAMSSLYGGDAVRRTPGRLVAIAASLVKEGLVGEEVAQEVVGSLFRGLEERRVGLRRAAVAEAARAVAGGADLAGAARMAAKVGVTRSVAVGLAWEARGGPLWEPGMPIRSEDELSRRHGLGTRALNCLQNANVGTVGELVVAARDLPGLEKRTKNFGRASSREIRAFLDKLGPELCLMMEVMGS